MLSLLVCSFVAGSLQAKLASVTDRWLETFEQLCAKEPIAIVADFNKLVDAPDGLPPFSGSTLMRFVASAQRRQVVEVDGTYVLVRATDTGEVSAPRTNSRLVTWLESLSLEEIERLSAAGVKLGSLDPDLAAELLPSMLGLAGQKEKVLARPWEATLQLSTHVDFQLPTAKRETEGWYTAIQRSFPPAAAAKDDTMPAQWQKAEPLKSEVRTGGLVFPKPVLLELKEIMSRAEKAFRTQIAFDRRLDASAIVIKGSFTFEQFRAAMDRVLTPIRVAPFGESQTVQKRLAALSKSGEWKSFFASQWRTEADRHAAELGLERGSHPLADLSRLSLVESRLKALGLEPKGNARLRTSLLLRVSIGDAGTIFMID